MSELIDVACDICGRQYRWPDERLGDSATCRECDTEFEVTAFVPPEDDSAAVDEMRWFKNAGIIVLLMTVVVGLSSLLVIRPGEHRWNMAHQRQPAFPPPSAPAAWPSNPTVPTTHPDGTPLSYVEIADAQAERFRQQHAQRGFPPPSTSGFSPMPQSQPVVIPRPGNVTIIPPSSIRVAAGAPAFGQASPAAGLPAITAPVVTEWEIVEQNGRPAARFKGQGLQGVTRCEYQFGAFMKEQPFNSISETLLETDAFFLRADRVSVFVITNPKGAAVVFSDNIETIGNHQVLDRRQHQSNIYLVNRGGHLTSNHPCSVLVAEGGRAEVTSWVNVGFVKRGGELNVRIPENVRPESGANTTPPPPNLDRVSLPVLTFCPLPAIGR